MLLVSNNGAIQVLRNAFSLENWPYPPPRNANNVEHLCSAFFRVSWHLPPATALRNTWMAPNRNSPSYTNMGQLSHWHVFVLRQFLTNSYKLKCPSVTLLLVSRTFPVTYKHGWMSLYYHVPSRQYSVTYERRGNTNRGMLRLEHSECQKRCTQQEGHQTGKKMCKTLFVTVNILSPNLLLNDCCFKIIVDTHKITENFHMTKVTFLHHFCHWSLTFSYSNIWAHCFICSTYVTLRHHVDVKTSLALPYMACKGVLGRKGATHQGMLEAARRKTRSSDLDSPSICTSSSVFILRLPSCSLSTAHEPESYSSYAHERTHICMHVHWLFIWEYINKYASHGTTHSRINCSRTLLITINKSRNKTNYKRPQ